MATAIVICTSVKLLDDILANRALVQLMDEVAEFHVDILQGLREATDEHENMEGTLPYLRYEFQVCGGGLQGVRRRSGLVARQMYLLRAVDLPADCLDELDAIERMGVGYVRERRSSVGYLGMGSHSSRVFC